MSDEKYKDFTDFFALYFWVKNNIKSLPIMRKQYPWFKQFIDKQEELDREELEWFEKELERRTQQ